MVAAGSDISHETWREVPHERGSGHPGRRRGRHRASGRRRADPRPRGRQRGPGHRRSRGLPPPRARDHRCGRRDRRGPRFVQRDLCERRAHLRAGGGRHRRRGPARGHDLRRRGRDRRHGTDAARRPSDRAAPHPRGPPAPLVPTPALPGRAPGAGAARATPLGPRQPPGARRDLPRPSLHPPALPERGRVLHRPALRNRGDPARHGRYAQRRPQGGRPSRPGPHRPLHRNGRHDPLPDRDRRLRRRLSGPPQHRDQHQRAGRPDQAGDQQGRRSQRTPPAARQPPASSWPTSRSS
jgi:hypothetical protein